MFGIEKVNTELDLFVHGVSALCYDGIFIYFNGFRKKTLGKYYYRPILATWNIHHKSDLDERCRWLVEEGARKNFNKLWSSLRMESDETRKSLIEKMPLGDDMLPMIKMIDDQLYAFPHGGILALDYVRYIFLTECGRKAKFIEEKVARERIIFGIRKLQQAYGSWEEMITAYAFGKQTETVHATPDFVSESMRYVKRLLTSPHSPMNKVDWNMKLPEA